MRNVVPESPGDAPRYKRYWNKPKSIVAYSLYWHVEDYEGPDVPALKMRGMWLRELGFLPGCHVYVTVTDAGILLSVTPPEPVVPKVRKMGKRQLARSQQAA